MRVLEMTGPGEPGSVFRFGERAVPEPAAGQVRIRVAFAGLNFTDVLARRGAPGYATGWPFVPGMEVAGTVDGVGRGVTEFGTGDRVVAFAPDGGGYAEHVVADARFVAPVPGRVGLAAAAGIPLTWATALGLVRRAAVQPGERVLVTSAGGGVGTALAAVLARTAGPTVVVVGGAGSARKAARLAAGYRPVVRTEAFAARAADVAGGVFDVILDSVGGTVLADMTAQLAVGGRLVSYGGAAGVADPATPPFAALRAANQTVSGFSILRLARTAPERAGALIRDVLALVQGGLPLAEPRVVPWAEFVPAHVAQSEGRAAGKTVVSIAPAAAR